MLNFEDGPDKLKYFIVRDEKPETPCEGTATFSPAEMIIKLE